MKNIFLIIGFWFLPFTLCFAQKTEINELKSIIQQNKKDAQSASAHNWLVFMGKDYGITQNETTIKKALQISRESKDKAQISFALLNESLDMVQKGKYDSALKTAKKAKEILNQTDTLKNKELLAIYYFTKGMILLPQGSFKDETLAHFLSALKLSKNTNSAYLKAVCYSGVGKAYDFLRQHDNAINNNKAYLEFALSKPVDSLILAKAYNNLGSSYLNKSDLTNAEKYYKAFEQLLPNLQSPYMSWLFYHNKAHRLTENGDYKTAIENALKAIEITNENDLSPIDKLASYYLLGYIYMLNNDLTNSKSYILQTYNLAKQVGSSEYQMYAVSGMAEIEGLLENYNSAAEYLKQQNQLTDQISNEKSKINANLLTIQYQTAEKEAQIKLQQAKITQKNTLNYILLGSAIGLVLIILLLYGNYSHRQKLQKQRISELETEKQLLATQSLLKGQEDERSRLAKDLHDGLGGLLSGVKLQFGAMKGNLILTEENGALFNNALDKLDQSISEMRRVAHNMMPEALLRLGLKHALQDYCDGINITSELSLNTEFYGLDERMNATTEVSIYRIVQELVNNVIKHAAASKILVQVIRRGESLNITVEDNGKGFDPERWQEKITAGLQNIQSRVHYLGGSIDISSQPDKGTSVYVECTIEENG